MLGCNHIDRFSVVLTSCRMLSALSMVGRVAYKAHEFAICIYMSTGCNVTITNMQDLYRKLDVKYCYMYIEHVIDSVTGHARTTASDICAA